MDIEQKREVCVLALLVILARMRTQNHRLKLNVCSRGFDIPSVIWVPSAMIFPQLQKNALSRKWTSYFDDARNKYSCFYALISILKMDRPPMPVDLTLRTCKPVKLAILDSLVIEQTIRKEPQMKIQEEVQAEPQSEVQGKSQAELPMEITQSTEPGKIVYVFDSSLNSNFDEIEIGVQSTNILPPNLPGHSIISSHNKKNNEGSSARVDGASYSPTPPPDNELHIVKKDLSSIKDLSRPFPGSTSSEDTEQSVNENKLFPSEFNDDIDIKMEPVLRLGNILIN